MYGWGSKLVEAVNDGIQRRSSRLEARETGRRPSLGNDLDGLPIEEVQRASSRFSTRGLAVRRNPSSARGTQPSKNEISANDPSLNVENPSITIPSTARLDDVQLSLESSTSMAVHGNQEKICGFRQITDNFENDNSIMDQMGNEMNKNESIPSNNFTRSHGPSNETNRILENEINNNLDAINLNNSTRPHGSLNFRNNNETTQELDLQELIKDKTRKLERLGGLNDSEKNELQGIIVDLARELAGKKFLEKTPKTTDLNVPPQALD